MGAPNDRRVIYGAHVVPQEAIVRDEGVTTHKLDATVGKRFGGKGSVDINTNQEKDGWVSFLSPIDDTWDSRSEADDQWEDTYTIWDRGGLEVTTAAATFRSDTANIDFLYVKNLGSVECKLALHYDDAVPGDNFDILIPSGAAVSMRVNSMSSANIKVATASSTTTIEYVIAKTP